MARYSEKMARYSEKMAKTIAGKYGITVIDVEIDPDYPRHCGMPQEEFVNFSHIIGSDLIVLGIYDDPELKYISFFHELGHALWSRCSKPFRDPKPPHHFIKGVPEEFEVSTLTHEIQCWNMGLLYARELGIKFSDYAIVWGYEEALTYKDYE